MRRFLRTPAVFTVVLMVILVATHASAASSSFSMDDGASTNGNVVYFRGKPVTLPTLETVLGQDFDVSVVTDSYGVFNATLRVRSSVTFPERLHGEMIPYGDARLTRPSMTKLPHFDRLRSAADERYSEIPQASGVLPKPQERPTLLVFDILLQHSDSPQGSISVYYLPADELALEKTQESLQEGSLSALTVATFEFKPELTSMSTAPLRSIPQLARTASNVFFRYAASSASQVPESDEGGSKMDAAASTPSTQGDFAVRLFSEREFWCQLRLPPAPPQDGAAPSSAPLENVWVYGYTEPNRAVLNREANRPWYSKYSVFILGSLAFAVQIVSGIADGWRKSKAADAAPAENSVEGPSAAPQAVGQGKKKN